MRTLNVFEIEVVNGAGAAQERGAELGKSIGSIVDTMTGLFGQKTTFTAAFTTLGSGIGSIIEFDFLNGFKALVDGVTQTINAFNPKPE